MIRPSRNPARMAARTGSDPIASASHMTRKSSARLARTRGRLVRLSSWRDDIRANSGGRSHIAAAAAPTRRRSEEHTSELQSLMRISYAVLCLKQKTDTQQQLIIHYKTRVYKHTKQTKKHE